MFASRQVEIPFSRVIGRQLDGDLVQLHELMGETQLHVRVNMSFWLQNVWLLTCWNRLCQKLQMLLVVEKDLKTPAKSVRKRTLRKQFGSESKKKTTSIFIPTKFAEQNSRSQKDVFPNLSL